MWTRKKFWLRNRDSLSGRPKHYFAVAHQQNGSILSTSGEQKRKFAIKIIIRKKLYNMKTQNNWIWIYIRDVERGTWLDNIFWLTDGVQCSLSLTLQIVKCEPEHKESFSNNLWLTGYSHDKCTRIHSHIYIFCGIWQFSFPRFQDLMLHVSSLSFSLSLIFKEQ